MKVLDIVKDSKLMSTIWKQELGCTEDTSTLDKLVTSYVTVSMENLVPKVEVDGYLKFYRQVLKHFKESV